jgi:hypothetical protein
MTITPCTHVPGGDCCNLGVYACPDHFTQTLSRLMLGCATNDRPEVGRAAADLYGHGWLTAAILTMCSLIQVYGPEPGESADEAIARVDTNTDRLPDQARAEHSRWIFLLGVLMRSALAGDGDTIMDTLRAVADDPQMTPKRTMSLITSLARQAHHAVYETAGVTPQTLATFGCLGSQTLSAEGFGVLGQLVELTDAFRTDGLDRPELAARFIALSPEQMVAAVGVCGRALGQLIDPDGPMLVSTTGMGPNAGLQALGVVEWRDESLDATSTPEDVAPARAMRVAVAFARGERDHVVTMLSGDNGGGPRVAMDVVLGSCVILSQMVAANPIPSSA